MCMGVPQTCKEKLYLLHSCDYLNLSVYSLYTFKSTDKIKYHYHHTLIFFYHFFYFTTIITKLHCVSKVILFFRSDAYLSNIKFMKHSARSKFTCFSLSICNITSRYGVPPCVYPHHIAPLQPRNHLLLWLALYV